MNSFAEMTPRQRSTHMALIRGRDTKPEQLVREFLDEICVTYETHAEDLPGTPDIVVRERKVAIFVHGCFWHQHKCRRQKPKANRDYWETKFAANIARDRAAANALRAQGWSVLVIWECQAKRGRAPRARLLRMLAPTRRLCHDCSHVARPGYAFCERCASRYQPGNPAPPRRLKDADPGLRKRRRALSLCTRCGMPAREGSSLCPEHGTRRGARKPKALSSYRKLLAQGLCRCKATVAPGRTRCVKCLRRMRRAAKARHLRYKAEGRCRCCPAAPLPGRAHCAVHHAKARASAKKAVARLVERRRANNECVGCRAPSDTYHCESCRKKQRRRARRRKQGVSP